MAGGTKGGKNRKYGRGEKYCKLYTAAGLQEKNQKRRMRRHILRNPDDKQTAVKYEKAYGKVSDIRVSVGGKLTDKAMTNRARKHLVRKDDDILQAKLRAARDGRRHTRMLERQKITPKAPQPAPAQAG